MRIGPRCESATCQHDPSRGGKLRSHHNVGAEAPHFAVYAKSNRAVLKGETATKITMVGHELTLEPLLVELLTAQVLLKKDDPEVTPSSERVE